MINFVSTFPPIVCGVGDYVGYLVGKMPSNRWRVTSFKTGEGLHFEKPVRFSDKVSYEICAESSEVVTVSRGETLWFQHAFGIWGRESPLFVNLVKAAKEQGHAAVASFHTIHFESTETASGMTLEEEALMRAVLPLLDAVTVFTTGAFRSLSTAFPNQRHKIVLLRHGMHCYPLTTPAQARKALLNYLIERAPIPESQKEHLRAAYGEFFSDRTVLLGNLGFITPDKSPASLFELGVLLQDRLPKLRVKVIYIGTVQERRDSKATECTRIAAELRSASDGSNKIFIEHYVPDHILPYAYGALDFSVFWVRNCTQSGRMAHAFGTGTCVVGREIEGIGETLSSSGLPSAHSLEMLAEKICELIAHSPVRNVSKRSALRYAALYSFERQAHKHLVLESAIRSGQQLSPFDNL